MECVYYIVDVFTGKAFNGAQLAVFPHANGLEEQQMQILAKELNLAESIFLTDIKQSEVELRIFSPQKEKNFSGQAMVAAGYVLGRSNLIELKEDHNKLVLVQKSGRSDVYISKQASELFIQFSRPAEAVVDRFVPSNSQLADMLSLPEKAIANSRYNTLMISSEQAYLIIPLNSFESVRRATFSLKDWSNSIAPVCSANEILLFATRSDLASSNFHGRLIGPQIGVDVDPPIASTMPAFANYLAAHDHIRQGTYSFVIDRGTLTTRKSVLTVEMVNHIGKETEIRVGGPAVIVAEGKFNIP